MDQQSMFMGMCVRLQLFLSGFVRVLVVGIVDVRMGMHHWFMHMFMFMVFGEM